MIVEVGATLSAQPAAGQFRKGQDTAFDRGSTVLNFCQCQLFSRYCTASKGHEAFRSGQSKIKYLIGL